MAVRIMFYSLKYLFLKNEKQRLLVLRDFIPTTIIAILLSAPFVFIDNSNYFGAQGFLERVATLASALTGFFVAALVAVATFSDKIGDLDVPIEFGRIYANDSEGRPEILSRREYVCSMFGYLSFMCLFLSIFSILVLVISTPSKQILESVLRKNNIENFDILWPISRGSLFFLNVTVSHIIVTTCHGLYYMVDRIYAKMPVVMPKSPKKKQSDEIIS